MEIGDIYLYKNYHFKNTGHIKDKLFVQLNEPPAGKPFLLAITTSQIDRENIREGCNPNHFDYYILAGKVFPKNTRILLADYIVFDLDQFHDLIMKKNVMEKISSLSEKEFKDMVVCYGHLKEDIPDEYFSLIGSKF